MEHRSEQLASALPKEGPLHGESRAARGELLVDHALEQTFPASDPPSWTLGRSIAGRGDRERREEEAEVEPGQPEG